MERFAEVGPGVFAVRYRFFDQQIGVVVGADGVLVVDTRTTHRQADELRAAIRRITPLAVTVVVNTHGHSDHCFGNRRFRPAPIWGHVRCATMIERTGERQRAGLIREFPALADELSEVVFDPPDHTFEASAAIDVGGRPVALRHLGRGHTDNDIVVLVPDADVLFAGDLLENGAPPYFGDSYPIDWPATVEALLPLVTGAVVPGHGDAADRAFAAAQLEDLRAIAALAGEIHAGAIGLDAAVAHAPFGAERSREPIERALAQLRGELD
jgi:glyoxylase-like metal-dependent hydrolase (beta-lactamase superfamily II)